MGKCPLVQFWSSFAFLNILFPSLTEGWYVVGTGNTGVAAGLATMGAAYFAAMFASSLLIKRPPAGYLPAGYTPPAPAAGAGVGNVPVDNLLKTPQFWLLWSTATLLATGLVWK